MGGGWCEGGELWDGLRRESRTPTLQKRGGAPEGERQNQRPTCKTDTWGIRTRQEQDRREGGSQRDVERAEVSERLWEDEGERDESDILLA